MKMLQIDFPYAGPWSDELAGAMEPLAADIAAQPGLLWKLWTENEAERRAGGIYAFADDASREAYLAKHVARLGAFGVQGIRAQRFDVNRPLSTTTRGPLQ